MPALWRHRFQSRLQCWEQDPILTHLEYIHHLDDVLTGSSRATMNRSTASISVEEINDNISTNLLCLPPSSISDIHPILTYLIKYDWVRK